MNVIFKILKNNIVQIKICIIQEVFAIQVKDSLERCK